MFVPDPRPPESTAGEHLWIGVRGSEIMVDANGALPSGDDPVPDVDQRVYVGLLDDQQVWAIDLADHEPPDGFAFEHLRGLYGRVSEERWTVAGRAVQLVDFERSHAFCGRCGEVTKAHHRDRAKVCTSCDYMVFPRLAPAVIMLVEKDDQILLAWGRQFPGRFFSALAGFVEPGESLEQTVAREVREEAGIEVSDIAYFGSQPWPFPHSLMLGFTAKWKSGDIVIQEEEIVEADWYGADNLPPVPTGRMSIAGWLIEEWLAKQAAAN